MKQPKKPSTGLEGYYWIGAAHIQRFRSLEIASDAKGLQVATFICPHLPSSLNL